MQPQTANRVIAYTVLGGYLGAGKTTVLNHLLKHSEGVRIALLINDFGDINIDAQLVESQTDDQINLANGCVCCTLTDGYFEALETLQALDPPPEHIVVEASGVANVTNLAQYGRGGNLTFGATVVVADAETIQAKAQDKYVAQTVQRQLQGADLIVLNKVDLCSAAQLSAVSQWLDTLTQGTPVVTAVHGAVPLSILLNADLQTPRESDTTNRQHLHEAYTSWELHRAGLVSLAQVEQFVAGLMQTASEPIIRAKGLFSNLGGGCIEVQIVGKRCEVQLRPNQQAAMNQFVIIGLQDQLTTHRFDALAARLLFV